MNCLVFFLGIPCGALMFVVGKILAKKTKMSWLQPIPLAIFCMLVIIVDIIF